jgi:hypothetical protein
MTFACNIRCLHIIIDAFCLKLSKTLVLLPKAYNIRCSILKKAGHRKHPIIYAFIYY